MTTRQEEHDAWMGELMLMGVWPKHVRGVARHTACGKIMVVETDTHEVVKPPHFPTAAWCFYCDEKTRPSDVGIEHWDGVIATKLWAGEY